jgi:hypothetical protein
MDTETRTRLAGDFSSAFANLYLKEFHQKLKYGGNTTRVYNRTYNKLSCIIEIQGVIRKVLIKKKSHET